MSPAPITEPRRLDLAPDLRAAADARQEGQPVPGAIKAQAVAAIQSGAITATEVAADLRIGISAVSAWCNGKVTRAGERDAPVAPAEVPPEVVAREEPMPHRNRTGDRLRALARGAAAEGQEGADAPAAALVPPETETEPEIVLVVPPRLEPVLHRIVPPPPPESARVRLHVHAPAAALAPPASAEAASAAPAPAAEAIDADPDPEVELTAEAKDGSRLHDVTSTDPALDAGWLAAARDALARVRGAHWQDWLTVGRVLTAGRNRALRLAGTNQPFGRAYQRAFDAWLQEAAIDLRGVDKPTRSALYDLTVNLGAVEAWRATLTESERLRLNHPRATLHRWRNATRVSPPRDPTAPPPAPTGLRGEVARLVEERDRLKAQIEGDALDPLSIVATAPEDTVARALVQRWSTREVRRFATALIARAEARDQKQQAVKRQQSAKPGAGPTRH